MSLDWAREGGDTEQCQLLQVELTECMMEQCDQDVFKDTSLHPLQGWK